MKEDYAIIIAKSPDDLIKEGAILHNCVGKMGYDQKFAREETLIFFVRSKADIETPFVTLEYSLKNHKVLQCYGYKNTKPQKDVLEFVNKIWLPYANKKLQKIVHREEITMTNYFRITGYHPQEDYCFIIDCNGRFEKKWQFSSFLIQMGVKVLEISDSKTFINVNIT